MKLECNQNTHNLFMAIIICSTIASIALGIGYLIYRNSTNTTNAIMTAKTCEQAVIISNSGTSSELTNKIYACKAKMVTSQ